MKNKEIIKLLREAADRANRKADRSGGQSIEAVSNRSCNRGVAIGLQRAAKVLELHGD